MKRIRATVEILDPAEEELIHEASVAVLAETGVHMPEERVLKLFEAADASVDWRSQIVKVPESLVMTALKGIRRVPPYAQAIHDLRIGMTPQPFMVDYETKTRRYGTLDDIIKGIVISHRLRHLSRASPIVVPNDVPAAVSDVVSYQTLYTYAREPGEGYINSEWSAHYVIELATAANRPVTYLLEPVSPLRFHAEHLRIALLFAEKGQHVEIGPIVLAGLTAPVTLAGALVIQNAEVLASLVLMYLLGAKGAYGYPGVAFSVDLHTGLCCFGSPNQILLVLAANQMARRYGLSCRGSLALTDALLPDFQAGFEKGLSVAFAALAGVGSVGNQGLVGADQGASLEQMVIDDEWVDALNHVLRGFDVTAETIGLDTIRKVGIGGTFLMEQHTVRHLRDSSWESDLFKRLSWDNWLIEGGDTVWERAHDKVSAILSEDYPPEPVVADKTRKEMECIVRRASQEIGS